jgi:ubiquinone/menaquinone biosynthesis C-methylase UbiE
MTRRACIQLLGAAAACAQTQKSDPIVREEIAIEDFPAAGYILDLGGGCRGTIGRMKGEQVVAIDISAKELDEAPGGFLKILMDASDLKFPKNSFETVTAFFTLMFIKPELHEKVFSEAFRVLKPGGKVLIWDASIPAAPTAEKREFTIHLHTKLPKDTIDYGYSVLRMDFARDVDYYRALAEKAGFRVESTATLGQNRKAFSLQLRKANV